jgi:hypothetical protein
MQFDTLFGLKTALITLLGGFVVCLVQQIGIAGAAFKRRFVSI